MGKCRICGRDAGFFSSQHSECVQKQKDGLKEIVDSIDRSISRPAAFDTDYFQIYDPDFSGLKRKIEKLAKSCFASELDTRRSVVEGWMRAVTRAVENENFSERTEFTLVTLAKQFELSRSDNDCHSTWLSIEKRIKLESPARKRKKEEQAVILASVEDGTPIELDRSQHEAKFRLQQSETLIWVFQNTVYREESLDTRANSRYGIRFPAKYRMSHKGLGTLGLTTKHIYFVGILDVFRIRYDRIGRISPCPGGIRIQRYAKSARPQEFITGEVSFTHSLAWTLARQA